MRKYRALLLASAIAAVAGTATAAEKTTTATMPATQQMFLPAATAGTHLATRLIGAEVYADAEGKQSIGNVNDVVIGQDGMVTALVIGVGGFLGVGEKNVAIDYSSVQWTELDSRPVLVATMTKQDLENAPTFDVSAIQPNDTGMQPGVVGNPVTAPATDLAANTPDNNRDMATFDVSTISAKDLMGVEVYSNNNDDLGTISDVVLNDDGAIDAVVLDVGGFLGIGAKPVAIGFDSLQIGKADNGGLVVRSSLSSEALDAATAYDADAYPQARGTMRIGTPAQ